MTTQELKKVEKISQKMLDMMEVSAQATAEDTDQTIMLKIEADDPGILIGRGGETLTDFQYIVRMIVNHQLGQFTYLTIDVNDYREKQQAQAEEEANQAIEFVKAKQRSKLLTPMNSVARRTVHLLVKDQADLNSRSVGEEPNRRVLIEVMEAE